MSCDLSMLRPGPARAFLPPREVPWMTWLLTGSILAVYIAQLLGAQPGADPVGAALALGPESLARHRFDTLLTYAWAHAVPLAVSPPWLGLHLACTVVPLFCVAPALERRCGPWWVPAVFAGGAVASGLAWLMSRPPPSETIIGASGAIFALIAAGGVRGVEMRGIDLLFVHLNLRVSLRALAIALVLLELARLTMRWIPEVPPMAHLGGAFFGAVFAFFFRRQTR